MSDLGTCRSCGAPMLWVVVASTGRRMPLDPEPRADGNVHLTSARTREDGTVELQGEGPGFAVVVGKAAKERMIAAGNDPGPWRVSHFATCPEGPGRRKMRG